MVSNGLLYARSISGNISMIQVILQGQSGLEITLAVDVFSQRENIFHLHTSSPHHESDSSKLSRNTTALTDKRIQKKLANMKNKKVRS